MASVLSHSILEGFGNLFCRWPAHSHSKYGTAQKTMWWITVICKCSPVFLRLYWLSWAISTCFIFSFWHLYGCPSLGFRQKEHISFCVRSQPLLYHQLWFPLHRQTEAALSDIAFRWFHSFLRLEYRGGDRRLQLCPSGLCFVIFCMALSCLLHTQHLHETVGKVIWSVGWHVTSMWVTASFTSNTLNNLEPW